MLEKIRQDPFIHSVISQNLFDGNNVYFYIGDTGRANIQQIVHGKTTYIMISPRALTQATIAGMHNDLWEPIIQLFLLQEGKTLEEVDQFNMDIQLHTWIISSFIGDPREFIDSPEKFPISYSLIKTLFAMHGKENYLKMPPTQQLFEMQKLLDTLSPQSVANILNKRLWWIIKDGYYQENNQGFIGSHDRQKAQKYVDEVNRVLINGFGKGIHVGINISKYVKFSLVKSVKNGKPFWIVVAAPKTDADYLPQSYRPDLLGNIKVSNPKNARK